MNPNARNFAFNPSAQGFAPPGQGQQQAQGQAPQHRGYQQQHQQDANAAYYNQGFGTGQPYYQQQQQHTSSQGAYHAQGFGHAQPQSGAAAAALPATAGSGVGAGYYSQGFGQQPGAGAGVGVGGGYGAYTPPQQQPQSNGANQRQLNSQPNSGLPPRPSAINADGEARKPVSLSLGGNTHPPAASSSAPRKPVSISIGGGSSAASAPPPAADKKPVSISIGGGTSSAKTAVPPTTHQPTLAATEGEIKPPPPSDTDNAEPAPASAVASIKAEEAAPIDASMPGSVAAPSTTPARSASPTPQSTTASTSNTTPTKTGGKTAKQSAKVEAKVEKSQTDAEKILAEAKQVTDEETLKDLFGDKAEDMKSHLNVVFIGHVDAGKSTMGGNLLYLTGMVDKRTLEKYERDAKEAGRESWYLSWALDSTPQEREKGKTVEVGRAYFETGKRRYTILDAPGHKTFVPSMISGAAQADVAILVISARRGEFETGFEKGGQTREHVMLVKTAGVQRLIVVVNKMDESTVNWEESRYNEITGKLTPFLRGSGFNPKTDVIFIPVSAYAGQNLKERVPQEVCSWYSGPSLLEFLDDLSLGDRKINEPLKMPISEKYNDMGTVVVGKLESGKLKRGDSLLLMPNRNTVEVVGIFNEQEEEVPAAISGDNVRIKIKGVDSEDVNVGYVLADPAKPVNVVSQFEAQLAILEHRNIIAAGYSAVMHVHTLSEEITIPALLHYYDKKTGKKSRKPPQFARKGMKIVALIETTAPVCIERFADYPQLGRFTVRDEGRTIGIGKVTKLLKKSTVTGETVGLDQIEEGVGGMKV